MCVCVLNDHQLPLLPAPREQPSRQQQQQGTLAVECLAFNAHTRTHIILPGTGLGSSLMSLILPTMQNTADTVQQEDTRLLNARRQSLGEHQYLQNKALTFIT